MRAGRYHAAAVWRTARLLLPMLLSAGATLGAQRVQGGGLGEDAIVLPRGVVRTSVGGLYEGYDRRYTSAADGTPSSERLPLGARLSAADLGSALVGGTDALQDRLRTLTGRTDLQLSFGESRVRAEANHVVIPMRVDVGLGWRLQLSAMVPYVRSRVSTDLQLNPTGRTGDVGLNPVRAGEGAAAQNAALIERLQQGASELAAAIGACGDGGGAGPVCTNLAEAQRTQSAAADVAAHLTAVFGTTASSGAVVVPVAGSAADTAVRARLAQLRTALGGFGVAAPDAEALPALAAGPLTAGQFQEVLTDTEFGPGLQPLRDFTRYGIGDVELGASFQLWDSFGGDPRRATDPRGLNVRASVGALVRLGTGETDLSSHAFDLGTGDGQTDVEVRAAADVLAGGRFWTSVVARYGVQLEDELVRRVPSSAEQLFVPAANARMVRRDLGDYLALEVSPRYAFSDFLAIGAHYSYQRKEEDVYTLAASDASSEPLALSVLSAGTEGYAHRAGLGVSLSTVRGFARGLVGVPLDVSYLHSRTVAGGGALTPHATRDEVTVRLYLRPFGRP